MMRRTVRSVGSVPGFGCFWVNFSMTVALAQAGSDRSPSMTGASDTSMRAARAVGLIRFVVAGAAGCADAGLLIAAQIARGDAALAPQPDNPNRTFPPGRVFPARYILCVALCRNKVRGHIAGVSISP